MCPPDRTRDAGYGWDDGGNEKPWREQLFSQTENRAIAMTQPLRVGVDVHQDSWGQPGFLGAEGILASKSASDERSQRTLFISRRGDTNEAPRRLLPRFGPVALQPNLGLALPPKRRATYILKSGVHPQSLSGRRARVKGGSIWGFGAPPTAVTRTTYVKSDSWVRSPGLGGGRHD